MENERKSASLELLFGILAFVVKSPWH